jgi:Sulfatase
VAWAAQRPRPPAPHVVLLVLDELPVTSLLDAHGQVDAARYPNFAALARGATWYRDTTSVHGDTNYAVPAILDGRAPRAGRLPVVRDHPHSVFELLAGRYRLHVHEEATQLCPTRYCAGRGPVRRGRGPSDPARNVGLFERAGRRDITNAHSRRRRVLSHLGRERPLRFRGWVAGIRAGRAPELDVAHLMMPHQPWYYLPSGRTYALPTGEDVRGLFGTRSFRSPFLTEHAWQRHLLQVGATDELLGELFNRLWRAGLWERSLVIVTADHGISFQRHHNRRALRGWNVGELAPVPMFVKAPGQTRGRISDSRRQTIDVLPTIAHYTRVRVPWAVDGRSLAAGPGGRTRQMISTGFHAFDVDRPTFRRQRAVVLQRKLARFGSGQAAPALYGIGPLRGLLGRRLSSFRVVRPRRARLELKGALFYRFVSPGTGFVPTHVQGVFRGGRGGGTRPVVVAVNGRVVATGSTFSLQGGGGEYLSVMVPEETLRPGRNRVAVLERARNGRLVLLARA